MLPIRAIRSLERTTYPDGQPKLLLTQTEGTGASKLVPTYNASFIYLRAYDADYAFTRRHAVFRSSGLTHGCVLTPTNTVIRDGDLVARVCSFHWPFGVNTPNGAQRS